MELGRLVRLGKRGRLSIIMLVALLLSPERAQARFINLGGSLDLSYGSIKTEQEDRADETSFFQQRYNLHNFGELFNPRIGTLLLNGTYLSQSTDTDGRGDQDFHFNDYSAALNLFPYVSPLSLYYQRVNRVNELESPAVDTKDRLTTIGGNWALSAPRLPRLSVSYNQSELEAIDDANRFPNTINRFLNLESSGRLGETTLIGRYQFNEADVARLESGSVSTLKGHAFNLSTESRLAPALVVSTFSRLSKKGGVIGGPGVGFVEERGLGASLFYTPSVKWDTHARIDYSETPESGENTVALKRQNLFWSGSYRPREELDMVMSARYFRFDISDVETSSPFVDYNINYRPFFGFSSGFGASYGMTSTKAGGTKLNTDFQRYRANVNYSRAIEALRYSSNYALSYGLSDTDNQGKSTDTMHTLSLGVENTRIRLVHLVLNYTFTDITRDLDIPKKNQIENVPVEKVPGAQELGDQQSHRVQLNANTSYFRGLLRSDDSLLLQSTASWTLIDGYGPDGATKLFDLRANYYFMRGGFSSLGYTYQDYPSGFFLDSNTFNEEVRYSFRIGRTRLSFGARAEQERTSGDSSLDRDTIAATSAVSYRIGKFVMSLDGRWSEDRSKTKGDDIVFRSQSIFARMSRSF